MTNLFLKYTLLLLIIFLQFDATAQKSSVLEEFNCTIDSSTFANNEVLKYKAYYNVGFLWIAVGETYFKTTDVTIDGQVVINSVANAFNYGHTAWIYEVKDTYQTYLDKYNLHPILFDRDVHEGGYTMDFRYNFDWENSRVYIDYMKKQNKLHRSNEWVDVPACTYDIMSAYHYARSLDYSRLQTNEKVPFTLFLDGDLYPVQVRYLGKETFKTKLGNFNCIKFAPELIEGDIFSDGDELVVYVSDDENKIPIYMEGQLSFGKVKVYLQEYENLRFPLDSKL